jgi:uncharacterized protein
MGPSLTIDAVSGGRAIVGCMAIPARLSIITLGVSDLARSTAFYEALGWRRSSASMDEIVWFALTGSVLGLFPRHELAADAAVPDPNAAGAFSGVTLAINLESEALVDDAVATAVAAGATLTKAATRAEWGGYSGYFADPDGHLWEVAYNPMFPLSADGALELP